MREFCSEVLNKKKNCTVSVSATAIQIIEEDGGVNEYSGIKVYRPVFRYMYNGQEYTFRNLVAKTSFKGLQIGMTVNLLINPEKPNEAIFVLN